MKINHKQLNKFLKTAYERKTPCFIWGTMGIGKSQQVRNVALEIAKAEGLGFIEGEADGEEKFGFIDVRVSQLEPSDLRGIPIVKDGVTKWLIPNWLPSNEKSKGILFFDELNLATPSIQASAYQLILDRRIGDYKLPNGWVIVSAGNTIEDRANVFELPSPLANRFVHIELGVPSKDDWVEWGLTHDIDSHILAFVEQFPSKLYAFNRNNKDKAFATPRSWNFCSNLIKDSKDDFDEKEFLIASAVGDGIAKEFIAFLKLQKKIDLNEILKNPESVRKIKEIDLKYAILSGLAEKYRTDKKVLASELEVCKYMEAEFGILLLRFLKGIGGEKFKTEVVKCKNWKDLDKQYNKYLYDLRQDEV